MIGLVKANPNATVSAVGTAAAALLVYLLGLGSIHLSGYYQLLIAGGVSSGLLFVGRNGIDGVVRFILHGRSGAKS